MQIRPLAIASTETTRPVSRVEISEPSIKVPARQVSILAASTPSAHNSAATMHRWIAGLVRETAAAQESATAAAAGFRKPGSASSEK